MDGLLATDVLAWLVAVLVAVLLVAVVALLVLRSRDRSAAEAREEQARAESARLHEQLAAIERRLAEPEPLTTEGEYVITRLGDAEHEPHTPQRIEGRMFADLVVRETVVKAAAWSHGVRRALAPETRNRIRFHMRQESKRARKERRAEMKEALRVYRAQQRESVDDEDAA